ncbi:MAG: hypothetical protein RLZZ400_925 [Actinomycetota bacterium]
MKILAKKLDSWLHPADAFVLLYGSHPYAFWLDREHHPTNSYSVIGGARGAITDTELSELTELLGSLDIKDDPSLPFEFRPGLVGAISFERDSDALMFVDQAIVFNHSERNLWFVAAAESEEQFEHWTSAALLRFALVGGQLSQYRDAHVGGDVWQPTLRHDPARYVDLIRSAQSFIAAGDVYQLCLTNEIRVETNVDPLLTFLRLREQNPAPYSTFLRVGSVSVVSASPEEFLRCDSDGQIESKPIKGTRRRGSDETEDREIIAELQSNEKERAENLMIVDLMRNDFGRVCEVGTVEVSKLFDVETYATVHQLVSTVAGKLAGDKNIFDAIESAFPGGSMTGAPKQRAIEIIRELEAGHRGIYSGAIGFIGCNGATELAMVIRTIVFDGAQASIGVGGGITIDSDPQAELEETRLKAKALLRALGADDPWN